MIVPARTRGPGLVMFPDRFDWVTYLDRGAKEGTQQLLQAPDEHAVDAFDPLG